MTLTPIEDEIPPDELEAAEASRRRAIMGLAGGFLAVLVLIVAIQWATDSEDGPEGVALPDLAFATLEGDDFALTSVVGQPTVINFFASWCGPCLAEMPDFEEVHLATTGDVGFIGVNTRETDIDRAREVVETTGVTYTILLGDDGGPGSLYQTVSNLGVMPTTAFVDADGNVVDVHAGLLTAGDLQDKIDELFG
jgi:thiol-disulfide isomerase/thioredoxin